MKQAASIELFSYWDALRAGSDRVPPEAASGHSRALLPATFLVEADARRAYPLRVVGSALGRLTANARLGASFLECWDVMSRDLLESMLQAVHDERVPVVIGACARGSGSAKSPVEFLLLPLTGSPRGKPRILGGLAEAGQFDGRPSPAPLAIVSARTIRTRSQGGEFGRARAIRRGPESRPAAPSGLRARLRVIEGGRSNITQV